MRHLFFFIGLISIVVILQTSCKKTDSPFGVYAPHGLDVPSPTCSPSPTFTPVVGKINVYVGESSNSIAGVTVFLVDPSGNTIPSQVTQSSAPFNAAFQISNPIVGTWHAVVPSQKVYGSTSDYFYDSVQPITITNSTVLPLNVLFNDNVFSQAISVWLVSPQAIYPFGGTVLTYGVSYINSGNLNEPVSLEINPATSIPANWQISFSNPILGTDSDSGGMTISIPCSDVKPTFDVIGIKGNGATLTNSSSSLSISRNYTGSVQLSWSKSSDNSYLLVTLNSLYDCGTTWTLSYSNRPYLSNFSIVNGQSITVAGYSNTDFQNGNWFNLSSPFCSAAVTFNNSVPTNPFLTTTY